MADYDILARFYDELMAVADYDVIGQNIERIFDRCGTRPKLTLDLGCGTGGLTLALSRRGYDMIGLDISADMLSVASQKDEDGKILWLMQDMTSFDLYGTVDAVVCGMDGVNHLADPAQAQRCMDRVSLFLNPSGLFVFDLITPFHYRTCFAGGCFILETQNLFCGWQSGYSRHSRECRHNLSIFERGKGDNYKRHEKTIVQRSFETPEIKDMLEKSGLSFIGAYDAGSLKEQGPRSQRIYIAAQKP